MYFARGNNAYNRQQQQQQQSQQDQQQQPPPPYSSYVSKLGPGYSGSSAGVADGSISLRQSSMLRSHQEAEVSGIRDHPTHLSNAPHYGGQYSLTYGSTTQQIPATSSQGNVSSSLELHGVYGSALPGSPKFKSSDYVASSGHVYGHKREQLYADRIAADYSPLEKQKYGERNAYASKDSLSDHQASRYADPIPYGQKLQHAEAYDRLEQAALLRQEQLLKAQSLQSASLDGNSSQNPGRRADYLAGRGQTMHQSVQEHNPVQDPIAYGGRIDAGIRNFSLGSSSFGGQRASLLGAAPQMNIEDLIYDQKSSNPGYGVSMPAGRDYGSGKGLHRISFDSDYSATILARGSLPIIDDHERKEKDRHRDLLRDREKDRERERLRERARDRERERERERDREKARERERERERILERRDKERARVSKSGLEIRRDRTPPRLSRDLRSSSLGKDAAVSLRRESPRREASYRRHSPVREKRKEYACKVYSFNLTEIQKDYLSLDKRYPRLLVSPDCSKVVVHWPKGDLKVSYNTPVSFEHDFVQRKDALELKGPSSKQLADGSGKYDQSTVWNAKIVLMSGLSQNALEDLLSDRNHGSRIPHLCNMLRFAILKKNSSLTMIGGPWDPVDGGDPSSDESSLICTALRHAKELTNLDLKDCQHWNRFLEIHYDRIGKNGLFSHKEVTVIFLPDLTDCLPSLNTWRDEWLAYKMATIEREQQHSKKIEKPRLKKEAIKDEAEDIHMKEAKEDKQPETKKEASPIKSECELKEKIIKNIDGDESGGIKDLGEGAASEKAKTTTMVKKKIIRKVVKQKVVDKKDGVENNMMQGVTGSKKETNKQQTAPAQVPPKQDGQSSSRPNVKTAPAQVPPKQDAQSSIPPNVKTAPAEVTPKQDGQSSIPPNVKTAPAEVTPKQDGQSSSRPNVKTSPAEVTPKQGGQSSSRPNVKTVVRKKIVKKVPVRKIFKEGGDTPSAVTVVKEGDTPAAVTVVKGDTPAPKDVTSGSAPLGQEASVKTTIKRKIIKKVLKRKVPSIDTNNIVADVSMEENSAQAKKEQHQTLGKQNSDKLEQKNSDTKVENDVPKEVLSEKIQLEDKMMADVKLESAPKVAAESAPETRSSKDLATSKDKDLVNVKGKSSNDKEDEPQAKKSKVVKDKMREEPPKHPGLILQTQGTKDSQLQSLSLSLDTLLDYTDKDIEDSTFELSLFAESLYEMLQYEMGCRILLFLQKLRSNFNMKRDRRKRGRDETKREIEKKTSDKRAKKDTVDGADTDNKNSVVGDDKNSVVTDNKNSDVKEDTSSVNKVEEMEMHASVKEEEVPEEDPEEVPEEEPEEDPNEVPEEEEPEEDPEEEEMPDANTCLPQDVIKEENVEMEHSDAKVEISSDGIVEPSAAEVEGAVGMDSGLKEQVTTSVTMPDAEANGHKTTVDNNKKTSNGEMDKELLQAFRFFDRNRVGHIRVEDMRMIMHSLGKCLPHRDVKELVQSALLESNTGRDDRILYEKLIRTGDV